MLRWMTIASLAAASLLTTPVLADDEDNDDEEVEEEDRSPSDHARHVGHLAIAYLGTRRAPAAMAPATDAVVISPEGNATVFFDDADLVVPLIGFRYWFAESVGVEVGLGVSAGIGGSETVEAPNPDASLNQSSEVDSPSTTAFAARLGVPISVYSLTHLNFMLIPEFDIATTSSALPAFATSTDGAGLDLSMSGLGVGGGVDLAGEVSFGFISLPQLSLQASFGARFDYNSREARIGDASRVRSNATFSTSSSGDAWEVLAGSFALLYTFM